MRVAIVDCEATCWENNGVFQRDNSEVIEIGAIGMSDDSPAVHKFSSFIRPVKHPILTEYCTNLTGIVQDQVDLADLASQVYKDFIAWASMSGLNGGTFVAWGNYDHKKMIAEMSSHGLRFPFNTYINLKDSFASYMGSRPMGLMKAINSLGWQFEGRQHSGIADATNTAKIFNFLKEKAQHVLVQSRF